jgi:hypothetical protein
VAGHGRTALPDGGHAWEATVGRRRPSSGEDDGEVRAGEEAAASAARMTEMMVHRSRSSSERRRRRSRSSSDWRWRSSARGLPPRPVQQRRRAGERVGGRRRQRAAQWRRAGEQAGERRRLGAVSMRRVQWARMWVKVNLAGLGAGACGIGFLLSTTVSCVPS